jgi:hypothetical protein
MNEELNAEFKQRFKKRKPDEKVNKQIKFYNKFGEESEDSPVYKALSKKADKSGITLECLAEVYDRGLKAYPENSKVSREQYAFARVNSFINQGATYFKEDADLHEVASRAGLFNLRDAQKNLRDLPQIARKHREQQAQKKTWKQQDAEHAKHHKAQADHHYAEMKKLHAEYKDHDDLEHEIETNHKNVGLEKHEVHGALEELGHMKDTINDKYQEHQHHFDHHVGNYEYYSGKEYKKKAPHLHENVNEAWVKFDKFGKRIINPKNPCGKGERQKGVKNVDGQEVPVCVAESIELVEGEYKAPSFDRTPPKVGSQHRIEHEGLNNKDTHSVTDSEDGHVFFKNDRTGEIYNTSARHFNYIRRPLKEELEEGKNTPYVKKTVGISGQDAWKAMNKHGKTKWFNNEDSANKHAGINEGYEEDEKNFNDNIDKINKEHNKKSNYHYDKAKEYSDKATLNGTITDLKNLAKANQHRKASQAHAEAAGACVMRHHSAMHKSKIANDLSSKLNEELKEGKMKEIATDLEHMDNGNFVKKYKKTKDDVKTIHRRMPKPVWKEEVLDEVLGPENDIGTDALVKKYREATPGQEDAETHENCGTDKCCNKCTPVKEGTIEGVPVVHTSSADKRRVKVNTPNGTVWRNVRKTQDIIK